MTTSDAPRATPAPASAANSAATAGSNANITDSDLDTNIDAQVFQIGANIIDQYDGDNLPTHIGVTFNKTTAKDFYGIEDLPYLYAFRGRPVVSTAVQGLPGLKAPDPTATHMGTIFAVPFLWNPHNPPATISAGPKGLSTITKLFPTLREF